ncbi:hypothetical protein D3C78_1465070 [compost metagenome]
MGEINNLLKKNNQVIALVLLVLMFSLMLLYSHRKKNNLKDDMVITVGQIVNVRNGYKLNIDITYEFIRKQKKEEHSDLRVALSYAEGKELLYQYFPVIYQKSNPNNCQLLISPLDFKEYNIPYPDSLQWVKEKYFKGQ